MDFLPSNKNNTQINLGLKPTWWKCIFFRFIVSQKVSQNY